MSSQPTPVAVPALTETEKFLAWYAAEKKNGLKDIKFYTSGIDKATQELFFAEFNRAINAEKLDNPDFF
jgi:hypothetical protein